MASLAGEPNRVVNDRGVGTRWSTSGDRLTGRDIAGYSAAAAGSGFYSAFNNAALPLLIPSHNVLLLNLLSNTRSIEGTVIQPIIGAWSDHTWTRLGRRRPFMLIALPLSCVFLALTPFTPGLGGVAVCVVLFSLCFNIASDPYTALEADIAPPAQRPLLNGMATTVGFFGQVGLGLFLGFGPFKDHMPPAVFVVVAVILLLTWLLTIATVRERRDRVRRDRHFGLRAYIAAIRGHRQAFRCLLALFCYSAGVNTILVNLTPFATHVLHVSKGEAIQLFLLVVLVTGLCTLPASWLAMRLGIKRVLAGGMVLMAIGASGALVAGTVGAILPCIVIAGIGNAAISSLTWPLLMQLIPPERAGVFAGLKSSAESISAFFSSFLAFVMIGWWGYHSIFLVLLVAIVCSLLALRVVQPSDVYAEAAVAPAVG